MRLDGRTPQQLRPLRIQPGFIGQAIGSCLIECGKTRVICTACLEEEVPPFLKGQGKGWITSEYGMLPGSTGKRKRRDKDKPDGRTIEIQRLIGRSLRAAVDLQKLGERSIYLDCDVIEADGGTRTTAITGAWIALSLAVKKIMAAGTITQNPITRQIAAVSCGIVKGAPMLDLCYKEDSSADVDFNVVMTDAGEFVEVQGTAEHGVFDEKTLGSLLTLARGGIQELFKQQLDALR